MPRHRNCNVVRLWAAGQHSTNHRNSLYSMEDGSLWSYNLKIGQRPDGKRQPQQDEQPAPADREFFRVCHEHASV